MSPAGTSLPLPGPGFHRGVCLWHSDELCLLFTNLNGAGARCDHGDDEAGRGGVLTGTSGGLITRLDTRLLVWT